MTTTKSDLEIVRATRELLSDPERWTQGDYAHNQLGLAVRPSSRSATCFCFFGGLIKNTEGHSINETEKRFRPLIDRALDHLGLQTEHRGASSALAVNEGEEEIPGTQTAHEGVLKLLDTMAELAGGQPRTGGSDV